MSRFVRPDTRVLTISQGDTLTVKARLTAGESRQAYARMYRDNSSGQRVIDPLESGMALTLAYLLDWSLIDDQGQLVVIREKPEGVLRGALDALDIDSFEEIKKAIEAHEEAMTAERDASKKILDGEPNSPAISPSLTASAGPSTTSEPSMPTTTTASPPH